MIIVYALIAATLFVMATNKPLFSPINIVICILFLAPLLLAATILLALK
jgi:hypothetical protein